ncbi:MAG TPA: AI-2E family transporter [Terracidiphilus sp.]|nr:AI-2E family transporter [Terracidiphilus sp.]
MNGSASTRVLFKMWLLVVAVVAIAVLYLGKVLFLPLAFAVLFAFLLAPLVGMLERAHLPRAFSAVVVILAFAGIVGSAGWVLFSQLMEIANDLPTYRENIGQKIAAFHTPSDSAFGRAQREIERINDQLGIANSSTTPALTPGGNVDNKPLGSTPEHPVQVREVAHKTGRLDQLGGVLEPLATAFLSVVFTFFVLLQREDLRDRVIRLSGDGNESRMTQAMNDASGRISRYFSLQLLVNLVYGSIVFAALYFIGLPHPLLFGALAGLFRFVPYVGAPVAGLLPTLLSLAVFHGWTRSAMIVGTFLCLEIVTANYVEPHVYGRHTGLSSLAILIAAAFWTLLWGPVGLMLSVPLTVCLVVMGRHVPSLEFLTVMLGDQPAMPASTRLYQRLLARDEREAAEVLESAVKDKPLEEVYDMVLIPALVMSEEDRLHRDLDESTVRFIRQSAREMIEELGFRASKDAEDAFEPRGAAHKDQAVTMKVMCVPVRDETDELAALMLAQSLDGGPVHAFATPVRHIDEIVVAAVHEKPDIVFLSGLPPFGMARSHRLYRTLRSRNPQLKIMAGIWNYPDNPTEAGAKIGSGTDVRVFTRLSDAVAEVRLLAGTIDSIPALAAQASPPTEEAGENAA